MGVDLGKRIKFFRKRAKMSQLELEIEIGASSGMISRIESNTVNPTKETVMKIAKTLGLNKLELDYLIGQSSLPATPEEIEKAKAEAKEYINEKNILAYLLDDRWRFYMISDTFMKVLNIKKEEQDYIIGRTTAEIITERDSPALNWVDEKEYGNFLNIYLSIYYSRMSHMDDDEIYIRTVKAINSNSIGREIWKSLVDKGVRSLPRNEERMIPFDIGGVKFKLFCIWNELPINSRFEVVEYYTDNKVLNLLKKFI